MPPEPLRAILDLARWAPSGDNTQPWRFEILDDHHFLIHGHDTRTWCVYDLDGRASQIALGALMETIAIAATTQGMRVEFQRRHETSESDTCIEAQLTDLPSVTPDPLAKVITRRVTQRRPLSAESLSPEQKQALALSVGDAFRVHWLEDSAQRWRMARLLFNSAHIRLTIPEAYQVHRDVIQWDAVQSEDRIPDQAVGLDPVGVALMRWGMQSWRRVDFLNRFLAGTWLPRLQLDLLPGYRCAAHALISSRHPLEGIDAYLAGGRAVQRFWLTATQLGLQFQPEMTPLIFSRYAREGRNFTRVEAALHEAQSVRSALNTLFPSEAVEAGVFVCRMGQGPTPAARSVRLPLERLLKESP
ncbi:molybdopterin biosynthesis protein MoeY [Acidihalobacter ferrooxydans]|uniref:Molybdopterin biosynthesis protein MoeY n=2 Tax=Acidihalobacter ferrooxydans TaxID=1765967 RepID=A0A1P8UGN1_9GAMM|nr:nitroreductase family protein [Acidihalobacter ferrooxydans]APZ42970.1 molybdopterin biosynthesis protein MoeY [Acidihalobacter ferrooxydans]